MSIPRLRIRKNTPTYSAEWPAADRKRSIELFHSRGQFRKLVVVFDEVILETLETVDLDKAEHLQGLLSLDTVRCIRINMSKTPADVLARVSDKSPGVNPEWAVFGDNIHDNELRSVTVYRNGGQSIHSVFGNAPDVAVGDAQSESYADTPNDVAAEHRRVDVTAAMAASAIGADIFITCRPYLHETGSRLVGGLTVLGLDEALAILGLYLRAQSTFVVSRNARGTSTQRMSSALYFWAGTWVLLPTAWRWFAALRQQSQVTGDNSPIVLSQSMVLRLQRSLQTRDAVHVSLNQTQNFDAAEDALFNMDIALLQLMGAFDSLARAIHLLLAIHGKSRDAGWQKDEWLKKLSHSAPLLTSMFRKGTDASSVLTIIRVLRNSIHGEALRPTTLGSGSRLDQILMGLPVADEEELMRAFGQLGADDSWGLGRQSNERIHVDPGLLLDQIIPRVFGIINDILAASPLEDLDHVTLAPEDLGPSEETGFGKSIIAHRQALIWQLAV